MLIYKCKNPFYSPDDNGGGSGGQESDKPIDKPVDNPETTPQEQENKPAEKPEDNKEFIPKETAMKWKRELRDLKRKSQTYESSNLEREIENKVSDIRKLCKEKEYDDDFADIIEAGFKSLIGIIPRKDAIDEEVTEELDDLEDIMPGVGRYKKEITETVRKYRKVDPEFSVESAIKLISPVTRPVNKREIETEIEQRNLLSRRNQEGNMPAASSSAPVKEEYPLTEEEKKTLKFLQQTRPERNWDAKKFYEMKKKKK